MDLLLAFLFFTDQYHDFIDTSSGISGDNEYDTQLLLLLWRKLGFDFRPQLEVLFGDNYTTVSSSVFINKIQKYIYNEYCNTKFYSVVSDNISTQDTLVQLHNLETFDELEDNEETLSGFQNCGKDISTQIYKLLQFGSNLPTNHNYYTNDGPVFGIVDAIDSYKRISFIKDISNLECLINPGPSFVFLKTISGVYDQTNSDLPTLNLYIDDIDVIKSQIKERAGIDQSGLNELTDDLTINLFEDTPNSKLKIELKKDNESEQLKEIRNFFQFIEHINKHYKDKLNIDTFTNSINKELETSPILTTLIKAIYKFLQEKNNPIIDLIISDTQSTDSFKYIWNQELESYPTFKEDLIVYFDEILFNSNYYKNKPKKNLTSQLYALFLRTGETSKQTVFNPDFLIETTELNESKLSEISSIEYNTFLVFCWNMYLLKYRLNTLDTKYYLQDSFYSNTLSTFIPLVESNNEFPAIKLHINSININEKYDINSSSVSNVISSFQIALLEFATIYDKSFNTVELNKLKIHIQKNRINNLNKRNSTVTKELKLYLIRIIQNLTVENIPEDWIHMLFVKTMGDYSKIYQINKLNKKPNGPAFWFISFDIMACLISAITNTNTIMLKNKGVSLFFKNLNITRNQLDIQNNVIPMSQLPNLIANPNQFGKNKENKFTLLNLQNRAKKLKINITKIKNGKRIYKSIKILKNQINKLIHYSKKYNIKLDKNILRNLQILNKLQNIAKKIKVRITKNVRGKRKYLTINELKKKLKKKLNKK